MNMDWKDRQQEVNIKASVFISKPDVSIEELSQSEELLVTALLFFVPSIVPAFFMSFRPPFLTSLNP